MEFQLVEWQYVYEEKLVDYQGNFLEKCKLPDSSKASNG